MVPVIPTPRAPVVTTTTVRRSPVATTTTLPLPKIPNVVGESEDAATQTLENAGYNVEPDFPVMDCSTSPSGLLDECINPTVDWENPPAGTVYPRGEQVSIGSRTGPTANP
jgi:beta-lactam-binding protein with PASTA domain